MIGGNPHPLGHAAAVFAQQRLVVGRAGADIEPAIDAGRYTACAGEKTVPDACGRGFVEQGGPDRVRFGMGKHCRLVVFGDVLRQGVVRPQPLAGIVGSGEWDRGFAKSTRAAEGRRGHAGGQNCERLEEVSHPAGPGKAFDFRGEF